MPEDQLPYQLEAVGVRLRQIYAEIVAEPNPHDPPDRPPPAAPGRRVGERTHRSLDLRSANSRRG